MFYYKEMDNVDIATSSDKGERGGSVVLAQTYCDAYFTNLVRSSLHEYFF